MSYENIEAFADPSSLETFADEPDTPNEYREASLRYLHVMSSALDYITSNSSPHITAWAVAYALGMPCAAGMSLTDRSAQLGCSVTALSKAARNFCSEVGIDSSQYQFNK